MKLTQDRAQELFYYDPESGILIRRSDQSVPGHINEGYLRLSVDGEHYYVHQVIFLYMTGYIPGLVDHANQNKLDNAWENLREGTKSQNSANSKMRVTNSSGYKGVSLCKMTYRWRASIRFNGKEKNLGRYDTKEEAAAAYAKAQVELFGEFASLGKPE